MTTQQHPVEVNYLPTSEMKNLLFELLTQAEIEPPFLVDGPGVIRRLNLRQKQDDKLTDTLKTNNSALYWRKEAVLHHLAQLLKYRAVNLCRVDLEQKEAITVNEALTVTYLIAENAYIDLLLKNRANQRCVEMLSQITI